MSQIQTPKYFKTKFKQIMKQVEKLENQDSYTARDVAIAADLGQQYSEVLGEMLDSEIILDTTVTAKVGNNLITFENTDDFTGWLAGVMNNEN